MRELLLWAALCASAEVGAPIPPDELAAAAITVYPDGRGLPAGQGSVQQGAPLYATHCAACHGARGEGTPVAEFPKLAGGQGSLATAEPVQTVGSYWPLATTLFDYTRRAMPYQAPASLDDDAYYAIVAYVLHLNGILGEDAVLDRERLLRVAMPNRHGFVPDSLDVPDPAPTR